MQYDFNLPPGGALNLDVKGKFFKYRNGSGMIRVRASKGGYVDLLPGQGVWNLDFDSLSVQDRSDAQNAGILVAGDFDFHDDRIAGTVDVIDGGRTRTLGGGVFSAARGPGATVGQINHAQLWNPVASGRRVVVAQITAGASAQDVIAIGIYNTMMTDTVAKGFSKLAGGAPSVAESRSKLDPVRLFSPMAYLPVSPWTAMMNKYSEPVVLMPGTGLCISNSTQNVGLYSTFEFYEEVL